MIWRSLQARLLALVLGLVALVWLLTAAVTWVDTRHELDELLDAHLAQAAALLVVQSTGELPEGEDRIDAPVLHRYAARVAFQVFHEGRLVLHSANAPTLPMLPVAAPFRTGLHTVTARDGDWRVFAAYGAERDVQVFVGERTASRADILWAVLRSMLWPVLLAAPLLALGIWWGVRRGLVPLRALGVLLAQRPAQALDPVVLENTPTEMTPLLTSLNNLLLRMGQMMDSERRFTADAAHELRTPIAAIRTQAQVALAETDDALRRQALQATLQGCDRATRLVQQLLTLSRLEATPAEGRHPVDLAALARQVAGELALKAIQRGQQLEADAPDPVHVAGDDTLLAVLLRNLLDNALRYSPDGATVRVTVRSGPGRPQLQVEDSGPGLAEADLGRLGERFFRVLGSGQSGSGLGWSIVRRIAAAHQAEVQTGRSADLGGLAVSLVWPEASHPPPPA